VHPRDVFRAVLLEFGIDVDSDLEADNYPGGDRDDR
jgi:hypothetical protein